jgi:hypothetical protein
LLAGHVVPSRDASTSVYLRCRRRKIVVCVSWGIYTEFSLHLLMKSKDSVMVVRKGLWSLRVARVTYQDIALVAFNESLE